jgi:hydrogenase expression/formation protein HypC
MCIGIPMQVITADGPTGGLWAECAGLGRTARIDMRLVGPQPVGTWVLTFLDAAREVIDAEEAARIAQALAALDFAMQGEVPPDHLFADLIGREPELPEFLRNNTDKRKTA